MKKIFCVAAAIIIGCTAFGFSGCNGDTEPEVKSYFMPVVSYAQYKASGSTMAEGFGYVMASDAALRIADENNFADEERYNAFIALWEDVQKVLSDVENSISVNIETSSIYKFNQAAAGATVQIDETAYQILSLAKKVYEDTDGYFNPAVYQSIRLYGFGNINVKTPDVLPDSGSVLAFKTLADGFSQLTLTDQGGKYYAKKPLTTVSVDGVVHSLKLDLGGIGKGWCADEIDKLIDKAGFSYGYFSFSSSTMAVKSHSKSEDNNYIMVSYDPRSSGGYVKFPTKNSCLSTSADYEQYYIFDGVRYCHIINPKLGSPIQTGIASVTVVGGSAAEDDALTTALSAMGKQKAVEYINKNLSDRLVVMLVFEDGQGKIITNRTDDITVLNEAYSVGNTVVDGKIVLN